MSAFIKENKWELFKATYQDYDFILAHKPNKFFTKVIDDDMIILVQKKTRELYLVTPMGQSPFMEVHTQFYQDLVDKGFIEFMEGRFD